MTTYFVWIDSFSAPPALNTVKSGPTRRATFAVEQIPSGPVGRLDLVVTDAAALNRCDLLRRHNGIQVSIAGEPTIEFIVDKALAKIARRQGISRSAP